VARAVSGHKRGDSPDDEIDPNEHRHTVSFSVRDSTRARFNAAVRELRRIARSRLSSTRRSFQTITDALEAVRAGNLGRCQTGEVASSKR